MNKYLIFRTDRIGDFLLSSILIKCIKRNDKHAFVVVVSSSKNFDYIKSFNYVDKVYNFENNILDKMNSKERIKLRQEIGMVFQGSALFDSMNVLDNITFPMKMFTKKSFESDFKVIVSGLNVCNLTASAPALLAAFIVLIAFSNLPT